MQSTSLYRRGDNQLLRRRAFLPSTELACPSLVSPKDSCVPQHCGGEELEIAGPHGPLPARARSRRRSRRCTKPYSSCSLCRRPAQPPRRCGVVRGEALRRGRAGSARSAHGRAALRASRPRPSPGVQAPTSYWCPADVRKSSGALDAWSDADLLRLSFFKQAGGKAFVDIDRASLFGAPGNAVRDHVASAVKEAFPEDRGERLKAVEDAVLAHAHFHNAQALTVHCLREIQEIVTGALSREIHGPLPARDPGVGRNAVFRPVLDLGARRAGPVKWTLRAALRALRTLITTPKVLFAVFGSVVHASAAVYW